MTTAQLRTFVIVCENMSFTQAAKQLYISQPAVSRQMASLEDELGVPLFERSHSAIQLTPAGAHLARSLGPIVEHLDVLINQVREIGDGQTGSLTIGLLLDQAIDQRMGRALQQFRQSHNISISIYRYDLLSLLANLKNGSIDMAVSVESAPNMFDGCQRYIYAQEHMCFAARRDLLLQDNDRVDETLIARFSAQHPVLTPRLDTFPPEHRAALAAHTRANGVSNAEIEYDLASIAPMVSAGLGGTIVNESHMLTTDQDIVLYPYHYLPTINKGMFWMPGVTNPLVQQFCDCLRELGAEQTTV